MPFRRWHRLPCDPRAPGSRWGVRHLSAHPPQLRLTFPLLGLGPRVDQRHARPAVISSATWLGRPGTTRDHRSRAFLLGSARQAPPGAIREAVFEGGTSFQASPSATASARSSDRISSKRSSPRFRSSARFGIVYSSSQLATLGWSSPASEFSGTSEGCPTTLLVMTATVTFVRTGIASWRLTTTTDVARGRAGRRRTHRHDWSGPVSTGPPAQHGLSRNRSASRAPALT